MARRKKLPKTLIGRQENVLVRARKGRKWEPFDAKIDTGASWSRIGAAEAVKLRLGPLLEVRTIATSDGGKQRRVIVPAKLSLGGRRIDVRFSVSMGKPGVLIGRRTMGKRFTVDPKKRYLTTP